MRKRFFLSKFTMFITLTLVPICIFGFISVFYINLQVRSEAETKTNATIKLMAQYMDDFVKTLEFYRVSVMSDARLHLALITALNNKYIEAADQAKLTQVMQSLYYSQSTKPYIESLYLTKIGSPYYINGIYRETFETASDGQWAEEANGNSEQMFTRIRQMKKNKFDVNTIPVVTIYYRLKYQELMALNVSQSYFNALLNSATTYKGQVLIITDSHNTPIFFNSNATNSPPSTTSLIDTLLQNFAPETAVKDECFYTSGTFAGNYNFKYLLVIPQKEIFHLSYTIIKLTLVAALLSIVLSSILAYFFTLRDYREISKIINLFDNAEKGIVQLPQASPHNNQVYFHIINNIISLFLSQTYLNAQLDAKKYALSTAQLSALQYQLNPHFLFNTLQSIDLEVLQQVKRPTAANQMIFSLSELLRYSLTSPQEEVPLEQEIAATKNYIQLQNLRLKENIIVVWDYAENVLACSTLRLVLQPIIENCITHGSYGKQNPLKIKIRIRQKKSAIVISIIDNGIGMKKEQLKIIQNKITKNEVPTNGKHIGLENVNQRLHLMYKNGYLKLKSKKNYGTAVEIGGIGNAAQIF